ncbi:hypothetical protein [Bradyrhizobium manausense]|uniref:hypothetical protein n=1 Tax=Bradyrhizobium manausense TaxID=989370 RepID=UPI001BA8E890|nr:hypothetical protein [Bradyrhizobium manausense]MBR0722613.1 hypothetical protein [Bradyrhizobium manausense]
MRRKRSFIADQRGTVAFEMPIVYLFIIISLLLPLADVAVAGFRYISAWQALRAFGQSILYSPPPDVTNPSSWVSAATAKADSNYPISNFQLKCGNGNATCSAGNNVPPMYYSYSTSITLAPIVLSSVLCASGNCTFTLTYTEQFQ